MSLAHAGVPIRVAATRALGVAWACLAVSGTGLGCEGSGAAHHPDWDPVADVRGGLRHQPSPAVEDGADAGLTFATGQPGSGDEPLDRRQFQVDVAQCGDGLLDPDQACDPRFPPPQVLTKVYQGQCGADARVQWGFLTYQATTPGDSMIAFKIRTSETQAGLGSEKWLRLASAAASPDTQTCSFAGPSPCPIDLYVVLGGAPRAHDLFAEIMLLLYRTSDGDATSSIEHFQLNYSCPFNQ
jgi:hypothetical protein